MTFEDRDPSPFGDGSRSSISPERRFTVWQETGLLVGAALVLAIVIKALLLQAFYIPSESMEPGLERNDRILVEKPSYWFGGTPARGDVVVFKDPGGWLPPEDQALPGNPLSLLLGKIGLFPTGGHLVKRVIGIPGDVIECCDKFGRISVNGTALKESGYARPNPRGCAPGTEGACYGPMPGVASWKAGPVPPGMLFVMGDNRAHSADSSHHLCTAAETDCSDVPWVPEDLVDGKVMALVWPFGRARMEHRPADFADVAPSAGPVR